MSDDSEKDVYKFLLEKHIGILIIAAQSYNKAVLSLSIFVRDLATFSQPRDEHEKN